MTAVEKITPDTLREWMENGQAYLVDIREPDEFRHGHIKGAVNIPSAVLNADALAGMADGKIVLQCNSGNRSALAAQNVSLNGQTVYDLDGGLQGWKTAGYSIETSGKAPLPLIRQVQIVVGATVLVSVLLGYFMHPAWLILAGAFGAGLLNAGLTGWCGMAKILAVMPWNKKAT